MPTVAETMSFPNWPAIEINARDERLTDGFQFSPDAAGTCDVPGCHNPAVAWFDTVKHFECVACVIGRLFDHAGTIATIHGLDVASRDHIELVRFESRGGLMVYPMDDNQETHSAVLRYIFHRRLYTFEEALARNPLCCCDNPVIAADMFCDRCFRPMVDSFRESLARETMRSEREAYDRWNGRIARADYFLLADGRWSLGAN